MWCCVLLSKAVIIASPHIVCRLESAIAFNRASIFRTRHTMLSSGRGCLCCCSSMILLHELLGLPYFSIIRCEESIEWFFLICLSISCKNVFEFICYFIFLLISGLVLSPLYVTWYNALEKFIPGTATKTVIKKILVDQFVAGALGTCLFFVGKSISL